MADQNRQDVKNAPFVQRYPGQITGLLTGQTPATFAEFHANVLETAKTREGYEWTEPLKITLEQAVAEYLEGNKPDLEAYEPNLYDEFFNQASELISICIARRTEIQNLEVLAFNTALSYLMEEDLQPDALALAKLNLKAARKQAEAAPDDADERILEKQDFIKRELRALNLAMHNQDGHAMNYGQRIKFLREIQGRDIRIIYEKLHAARLGLMCCAGLRTSKLPEWDGSRGNNLQMLVEWCSRASREYDRKRRKEYLYRFVLRVGGDELLAGGRDELLRQFKSLDEKAQTPMAVAIDISANKMGLSPSDAVRLVSLGIAVEFDDEVSFRVFDMLEDDTEAKRSRYDFLDSHVRSFRSQHKFTMYLYPPTQYAALDLNPGTGYGWQRRRIELRNEVGVWGGSADDGSILVKTPQVKNTNPIGKWNLVMKSGYSAPFGNGFVANLLNPKTEHFNLWTIRDIVLVLTMAVRDV